MTPRRGGKLWILTWASTAFTLFGSHAVAQEPRPGVDWPQFRGVSAGGVAEGFETPVRWNAETGENILWIFIAAAVLGAASGLFQWFVNFDFGF